MSNEEWIPFLQKITEEEGQLYAGKDGKRKTTRTWAINKSAAEEHGQIIVVLVKTITEGHFET